ncbi:Predicted flavoprotein CzcO associated with the cation diffusion facilitator CzcD [Actinokineospora alba]|uniref:Predicted flavoprotein CzcO associated with the cation diffusion facilitator CzcD n=1 Tax=Actinokineospora alba TaxID=504798 RepID=A0A1H0ENE8_9PSEU|nr:NAD(P)/FAD-dependent oxidoreductase [Actinokineospora alba]TDP69150.1 cation diffusion facilitator CzcD-associated flavoprotein CzcO [Actinokineospora alba]SDI23248.1 Predicted flavoprotein CzcO associated with the cation diffusion facilitator CzcD [Actinokineospora alba]SDN83855.1 Predicted flavoprotein CzcO associated with the cation diffusion facilitator CzcD [Actinokineospora alba]
MTQTPQVVIIGTGFGGIGMAIELKRAGIDSFTILEKGTEVGGVWRENTYPGAACDIPSPYYSFSYEPNPTWPSRFSRQPDIQDYLKRVVDKYGLGPHLRFGVEVTAATFDQGRWQLDTAAGERITADVLVPATGQLSRPAMPNIPGVESFAGPAFHSATWDHSVDLTGKRVAVIGTGASAVQFVPEIQPKAARLTVFQRSAPWILPRPQVEYRPWQRAMFRALPVTQKAERFAFWLLCEVLSLALVDIKPMGRAVAALSRFQLRRQVPDPVLRAKLAPDHEPGCKRGLFSGDYLPALGRPNVSVETAAITEIVPEGLRTADGVVHEADVIVYGTGFKATEFLAPMAIHGVDGQKLADTWSEGAHAYLGMAVPGFPNLFMMYGPNTNLGVGSIVYMLESQARYIRQAVLRLDGRSSLEVRADVAEGYDRRIQARLARSVWTTCSSWYRTAAGRITNNWPGTVSAYRLATRTLDPEDYHHTAWESA